jgi:hypothetical protein
VHHVIASRLFATGTAAGGALLGWGLSRWAQHRARGLPAIEAATAEPGAVTDAESWGSPAAHEPVARWEPLEGEQVA